MSGGCCAADCVEALERMASLQKNAFRSRKLCSLGRATRLKIIYVGRLAALPAGEVRPLLGRLNDVSKLEKNQILSVGMQLRDICKTINTLRNKSRLLESYQA
jgi:hypothetical protein